MELNNLEKHLKVLTTMDGSFWNGFGTGGGKSTVVAFGAGHGNGSGRVNGVQVLTLYTIFKVK